MYTHPTPQYMTPPYSFECLSDIRLYKAERLKHVRFPVIVPDRIRFAIVAQNMY